MSHRRYLCKFALLAAVVLCACGPTPPDDDEPPQLSDDEIIERAIDEQGIEPLAAAPNLDDDKVELGRTLFFDKILSGNRDTSCASCHHPTEMTSDGLTLGAGTGAIVEEDTRRLGPGRDFIPRNSTDLFNRGLPEVRAMFWDNRVRINDEGHLLTPAGSRLPDGLEGLLAAQAMFPVLARDEMRGEPWDEGSADHPNELADFVDSVPNQIWQALMDRLMAIEGYREMFQKVYPNVPREELGFQHAANAIAAFETDAYSFADSPWDRYLAGQKQALTPQQVRGAALFFGKAGCADCHSGTLLSDLKAHNLAVPQFGPGKTPDEPLDLGFGRVSNNPKDYFAFRTPSLHNVARTAPYMHNGAYATLEEAVEHHLQPVKSLENYDAGHLRPEVRQTLQDDLQTHQRILESLDPGLANPPELSAEQVADIVAFLHSLTSPEVDGIVDVIPASVPSGLPVD